MSIFNSFNSLLILIISFSLNVPNNVQTLPHENHAMTMGVSNKKCDDGKTSLESDWNGSPINYTCYSPHQLPVNQDIKPLEQCEGFPEIFSPEHFCMYDKITYDNILPTHGDHRPLWAKFGEYKFVPAQRWSHNVEHGAIIMLYHPCANQSQVSILRELVVNCIRKHIITAYNLLPVERPFALVGWGCRLLFNKVDNITVKSFIQSRGLKGPEGRNPKEGQYSQQLLKLAQPPPGSDIKDTLLCPNNF